MYLFAFRRLVEERRILPIRDLKYCQPQLEVSLTTATPPVETVRHYRLLERLGAGGMGVVYKAEDTKLGRTVALKFLPPELVGDDEAKQRFFIEARAAARLDHANICTIYETGEAENGTLYIAMAFYEGETLDRRIARGQIPLANALDIVRQVAQGLAHAHAAGIVHRDVKPGNIILTSSGVAKVLDFGLAKLTDTSMTRSRTTVGTAAYMAPEQIEGQKVTPATDVWALGVVLFELLTGKRPFGGEYEQAILYSILNSPVPPMRSFRPDIPLQFETVVQRMLEKEPSQRYGSMAELLKEISASDSGTTTASDQEEPRFIPGSIVGGRYRVVSLLGEGGMGAVYRADDLKLGQKVALKYIPPRLTDDATTFERICNEVRIGRQLSHPNICRVFDMVEAGSHRFIAMEFIDGEDLASLLKRIGSIPPNKALAVIRDVASGLAAAHDRGIIHRDLKPANIMIDGEGRARITDFGLAAAIESLGKEGEGAGTPAYMAPEQLARGEVTARSDIYALGLVMFELLSGKRLLDGGTLEEMRQQRSSSKRRLSTVTRVIDPALERIIAKCVEVDAGDRYPTVHAVIAALPASETTAVRPGFRRVRWLRRALAIAAALAFASVFFVFGIFSWRVSHPVTPPLVTRTTISLAQAGLTLAGELAVSPDGKTVVFSAQASGQPQLYVRRIDEWGARPLPGTERAMGPFFSPDGKWVAFSQPGKGLFKIPVEGGAPQRVCSCEGAYGGTWLEDGRMIVGDWPGSRATLWSIAADGGTPKQIARASEGDGTTWYDTPDILPNGRGVLFTITRNAKSAIAVLVLATGEIRPLIDSGYKPRYIAPGYITYQSDRIYVVPFDADRMEKTGPARSLEEGAAAYDMSDNGTLAYVPSAAAPARLVWKDRNGGTSPLLFNPRTYMNPALSPDGKSVVVSVLDGSAINLWTGSINGEPLTRLTFGDTDQFTVFTPDGKWVLYTSGPQGQYNIFRTAADGSGGVERLTNRPHAERPTSLSPRGDVLLLNEIKNEGGGSGFDIMQLDMKSGAVRPFVKTAFRELEGVFSPDGRFVAYASDETGRMQVYVQPYPGPGMKRQISIDGGQFPSWNPLGGELFYQGPQSVMKVPFDKGAPTGTPLPLFPHALGAGYPEDWTVSPDGKKFLVVESAEPTSAPTRINVVSNSLEALRADEDSRSK